MKLASILLAISLLPGMTPNGRSQEVSGIAAIERQTSASTAVKLEDFDRSIGPLKIKARSFMVVLNMKRIKFANNVNSQGEETVARMQIRDGDGKVHYERSFPYKLDGDNFDETTEVSASVLEGSLGTGLLITTDVEPSTPLGGGSYQVFGMFDDKLVPLSKPLSMEGQLIRDSFEDNVAKTSAEPGLQGEVLRFRIWSGNVFVIIPVRVDWLQAKISPAWRCFKTTPRGVLPICHFNVEAERIPPEQEMTFVRLHAEADETMGVDEHIVIKKSSSIDILEAEGELLWQEGADQIELGVGKDLWLKVRIDGKEGWIHTQEDFNAVGLPEAG
jgi:hypothetical protein